MRKLLLIVPVVLAAFLLAACSDLDSESTVTPAMSPIAASVAVDTSTPTTAPVAISAADVIAGVVDAMRQVTSLHFEMESRVSVTVQETSLTIPLKLSADYVAPDQVAGTLSATIAFVIFETQVVAIGNELYVTDPLSGEWTLTESNSLLTLPIDFLSADLSTLLQDPTAVEEELDGVAAYRVTATAPLRQLGDASATFKLDFWIGVDDGRLRRVAASGDFDLGGDVDLFEGITISKGSISMTATLSDFGKEVTIVAPSLTPTAVAALPADESPEAAAVRQVALDYWAAYNAYDVDAALSYLEAAYRAEQEADIRGSIQLMQGFGAKLVITEESPPVVAANGEGEIVVRIKDPLSTRIMRMTLVMIDGEWKISASEQQ
jgi:hypothetical protein